MKRLFTALFFITSAQCITLAQLPADSINRIIRQEVAARRCMSIALLTIDAQGHHFFGTGKIDSSGRQPDSATVYEIGSISKVFTTLLLADMMLKGEVRSDDPISKYLPDTLKTPQLNGRQVILMDLATQRGGFPRMPENFRPANPSNPYSDYSVEQLYDYLSHFTPAYEPGTHYDYSNYGMGLLGHILARKTGKDYETLLQERICKPLRMTCTGVPAAPCMTGHRATGYGDRLQPVSAWDFITVEGAGGIRSTIADMGNFMDANMGLLHSPLDSAMKLTHIPRDTTGTRGLWIAMGWHVWKKNGREIIWHNGGTGGFASFAGFDPASGTGIVVLTNGTRVVNDIGLHILDPQTYSLKPYHYEFLLADTMMETIGRQGVAKGIELYHRLKSTQSPRYAFDEQQLNDVGYQLLQSGRTAAAIEVFRLNTQVFPKSANVYDSLGEGYMAAGNKKLAIENYERSIALDPSNTNGIEMLKKLREKP
jgi:CubicO group peptidase (beta-lactamase class C family)